MICGDLGHLSRAGRPCGQVIGRDVGGCIHHDPSRPGAAHAVQVKGSIASRMRRAMPSAYEVPAFASPESIIAFAHELARLALTEDVDPRRVAEARSAAALALSGHSTMTQARAVEALLKIEHGETAFALLTRLQDGMSDGRRRPLPGRMAALPASDGDAS